MVTLRGCLLIVLPCRWLMWLCSCAWGCSIIVCLGGGCPWDARSSYVLVAVVPGMLAHRVSRWRLSLGCSIIVCLGGGCPWGCSIIVCLGGGCPWDARSSCVSVAVVPGMLDHRVSRWRLSLGCSIIVCLGGGCPCVSLDVIPL